jgi:poly(A) polymerase
MGLSSHHERANPSMKTSALKIVQKLRQAGHRAYWVGGCVRDLLLRRTPRDYDVATSAWPEEVQRLFPCTMAVGAKFGVVLVEEDGWQVEVSTFRSDGLYEDGRHPSGVCYTPDPRQDVLRRDFTINGMMYDPLEEQLLDWVGGQEDLQNGLIRAIGNPLARFREDRLRLMRALRFAARFGYVMEETTAVALLSEAPRIVEVSAERIREELGRILTEGSAARGLSLLDEYGLVKLLLPEVSALHGVEQPPQYHPEGDVWIHTLKMLELMDRTRQQLGGAASEETVIPGIQDYPGLTLAMGVLLHDIGKPPTFEVRDRIRFHGHAETGARMAAGICERLRFSRKQSDQILALVRDHLKFIELSRMRPATLKRFLRQPDFAEHLELHRLDCLASHGILENYLLARESWRQLQPEEAHPARLLSGHDLTRMGYIPGPLYQQILRSLEDAQLDGEIRSREEAVQFVRSRFPLVE